MGSGNGVVRFSVLLALKPLDQTWFFDRIVYLFSIASISNPLRSVMMAGA